MRITFMSREELAPAIWQYYFKSERPLDYEPGQYIDLHVLQHLTDPRGQMRTFTLTSIPAEKYLSIAAQFKQPLSDYKQALQSLVKGDTLRIDDAMGDVILPKSPTVPIVFIAGGLGIASYVSMLKQLKLSGEKRSIELFYARKTNDDEPFKALLEQSDLAKKTFIVSPDRFKLADITAAVTEESLVYVSGSETFVETMRTDLQQIGIRHEQIIYDFFDGYTSL